MEGPFRDSSYLGNAEEVKDGKTWTSGKRRTEKCQALTMKLSFSITFIIFL